MKLLIDTDWAITWHDIDTNYNNWRQNFDINTQVLRHDLPCDVHMPLIKNDIIKDPVIAKNCFSSEWIEKKSWWFEKKFIVTYEQINHEVAELVIGSIDGHAEIYLNDRLISSHKSAFYPFVLSVKEFIQLGENSLVLRIVSGEQNVNEDELSKIKYGVITESEETGRGNRGDKRRAFIRKPLYVYGFDWAPRIVTAGIVGEDAYIDFLSVVKLRDVWAYTESINNGSALVNIETVIEGINDIATHECTIELNVVLDNRSIYSVKKEFLLRSGLNYKCFKVWVENAELWWPNGMGQQTLYDVFVKVISNDVFSERETCFGIRTIEISLDKQTNSEREFKFKVNGVEAFCKGANWVPADSIYARVTYEKYNRLVQEAYNANFNMLRIWGGGLYEREVFYKLCDTYGIMIWHDFMYACSLYPDYLEWFRNLSKAEADYQTKRLRGHACMALWCGNNENQDKCRERGWGLKTGGRCSGSLIYDHILPEIVHNNCSHIPYWNSSPYGGEKPNTGIVGDVHSWHDFMINTDIAKRVNPKQYDLVEAKFVSEFGYPGPCRLKSIKKYFGEHKVDKDSDIWELHNNNFEKGTVDAGIKKHFTTKKLSLDEYLLYAGLMQSLMLGYALETMRFKTDMGGSLFWMYSDTWGETGWSIIDYYLNRKISYFGVQRAFSSVKLILRETGKKLAVVGVNDTSKDLQLELEAGYLSFDGTVRKSSWVTVFLPAHSRNELLKLDKKNFDLLKGTWFASASERDVDPAVLLAGDIRRLNLPKPKMIISETCSTGKDCLIHLKSETFVYCVYLEIEDETRLSDNWFNLLPGQEKTVIISGGRNIDYKLRCLDIWEQNSEKCT